MDENRREKIKELFDKAVSHAPLERQAYIEGACAGDAEMRKELEELLLAQGGIGQFLSDPTLSIDPQLRLSDLGVAPAVARLSIEPGTRIGPYKLLQEIGEGGFGVVYMAEQEEPVRRTVALKVIKLGMDTREVIARFEAERQALAMMDHPNIARVLDAGATASGRPYFVMELVRGVPITDYADANQLPTRERLDLFMKVCAAIQHAHQKGIIHRDIKPSNVLVTLHDGVPVPKVIDFGVAKATGARLTERTLFTLYGQLIGTPAYMSPEQAEMSGLDVDTRSDIYSLGVLLYELLTGTTPFEARSLREAGYGEIQRIIRETEPERPSKRISTMKEDGRTVVAKHRKCDARALERTLEGELDWIVLKTLEKDRTRRYGTAADLRRDVERYLAWEPVEAGPPNVRYRLRKLLRRRWKLVATAATVLAALLIGLSLTLVSLSKVAREADKANKVVGLFVGLFLAADPEQARGKDFTVRALLDEFSQKFDKDLPVDPEVEVTLRRALAIAYRGLNEFGLAERHAERALELAERHLGEANPSTISALYERGYLHLLSGRVEAAEGLLRRTLGLSQSHLGPESDTTVSCKVLLSDVDESKGRYPDAERALQELLESRIRLAGKDDPMVGTLKIRLAKVLGRTGRYGESQRLLSEAYEGLSRRSGENSVQALSILNKQSYFHFQNENFEEAESLRLKELEGRKKLSGEDHPDAINCMHRLAEVYMARGLPQKAEAILKEAEAIIERTIQKRGGTLGPEDLSTLDALHQLARIYRESARFDDAEKLMLKVLDLRVKALGEDAEVVLYTLQSLDRLYGAAKKYEKLRGVLQREVELRSRMPGDQSSCIASLRANIAFTYSAEKRYAEAAQAYEKVLEDGPAEEGIAFTATTNLCCNYMALGRFEEAEKLLREVVPKIPQADHENRIFALMTLAQCYHELERYQDAEKTYSQVVPLLKKYRGEENSETLDALRGWAGALAMRGKLEDALQISGRLLTLSRKAASEKRPNVNLSHTLRSHGAILTLAKRAPEAEPLLREALELRRTAGMEPLMVGSCQSTLGEAVAAQGRFEEAELLQLEGYSAMEREDGFHLYLKRMTLQRLVRLYEAWGKPDQATPWRKKLEELPPVPKQ